MVHYGIRTIAQPVYLLSNTGLVIAVEFSEGKLRIRQEDYFIHKSFLRVFQSTPLPARSSSLALRILFTNSGLWARSQSSRSSFVSAVSKTVNGISMTGSFFFVRPISPPSNSLFLIITLLQGRVTILLSGALTRAVIPEEAGIQFLVLHLLKAKDFHIFHLLLFLLR